MNQKTKVVFAGTPEFAAVALKKLIDCQDELNIQIVAVYTQPDRKSGRGQKITQSAVKTLALSHGIIVEQPESFSLKHEQGRVSRETLKSHQPDVMVVAAYGLILPKEVLSTPTFGCLNIHASLLPRWRGAAPIHRAILAGDEKTGITIMQMNQGLDTGDMLYKVECAIDESDDLQALHDRLAILGGQAIVQVLSDLPAYQAKATAQDESLANYAQKVSSDEGLIDWSKPARQVLAQVRALGAYSSLSDVRVKILQGSLSSCDVGDVAPATVISMDKAAVVVACGVENGRATAVRLTKLQWAGGKPLTAEQVVVGAKMKVGDVFGQ